jgi:hypothetical protein
MRAKTIRPLNCPKTPANPSGVLPAGSIDAGPDCWKLVTHGVAIPDDDECAKKVNMSAEELASVQHSYNRLAAGIHPEDWAAFDAGEMVGYDKDGRKIPGPNFQGGEAEYEASADAAEHETLA